MYRRLSLCLLVSCLAFAADPPASLTTLTALKADAQQKTQAWENLSKALESKIATLLPCDAKITASIDEVSRASDARLIALETYFEQAATVAARATQRADESAKDSNSEFLKTELAETSEQRAGIETELAPLSIASTARPELAGSESALRNIGGLVDKRTLAVNKQMALEVPRQEGLTNLAAIYQAREAAIKELGVAYGAEASSWHAYYTARYARAKAECVAITPLSAKAGADSGKKR